MAIRRVVRFAVVATALMIPFAYSRSTRGAGIDGSPPPSGTPTPAQTWQLHSAPACTIAIPPWPKKVAITPPDATADPALTGFLGIWEGDWGGFVSRVAFNMLDHTSVGGIYAYPAQGGGPAASTPFAGAIIDRTVTWKGQTTITFTLSDDGKLVFGKRMPQSGFTATVSLTRCSDSSAYVATPQQTGAIITTSAGFPSLPIAVSASDVAVIDNSEVIESPDAVQTQSLTTPVIGTLFEPAQRTGPLPAVLMLHGSEGFDADSRPGGLQDTAKHLAAQGFATLALCYFGCAGRPAVLQRIPLEYEFSAIQYLQSLPEVDSSSINIWGLSRGAELALLVGASSQNVRSVIASFGSPLVWGAFGNGAQIADCAWTSSEQCLSPGMTIPVEEIQGPVLLLAGWDDAVWPVGFSQQIADELAAAGHPFQLTLLATPSQICAVSLARTPAIRGRILSSVPQTVGRM